MVKALQFVVCPPSHDVSSSEKKKLGYTSIVEKVQRTRPKRSKPLLKLGGALDATLYSRTGEQKSKLSAWHGTGDVESVANIFITGYTLWPTQFSEHLHHQTFSSELNISLFDGKTLYYEIMNSMHLHLLKCVVSLSLLLIREGFSWTYPSAELNGHLFLGVVASQDGEEQSQPQGRPSCSCSRSSLPASSSQRWPWLWCPLKVSFRRTLARVQVQPVIVGPWSKNRWRRTIPLYQKCQGSDQKSKHSVFWLALSHVIFFPSSLWKIYILRYWTTCVSLYFSSIVQCIV